MKIVHYAWRYAVPLFIIGAGLCLVASCWLGLPFLIVGAWVIWFFRDPQRPIPQEDGIVLCPADGRICKVEEVARPEFPGGRAHYVAIFMNVFNVHVQCAPMASEVERVEYRPGKFVNADLDKASEDNECNDMYLKTPAGPMIVRQIAGSVARRIVCRARQGDQLGKGEKYGLIRFGSRVEVYMPLDVNVEVRVGQRVQNTTTILGRVGRG